MGKQKPLVNDNFLLERFPGKGGWTYTQLPGIPRNKNVPFGFVRVRGTIDGVEIKGYNMMPMKNGNLFLPIKAALRKVIRKEKGDYVHVILYADNLPTELPEELKLCLEDEPAAYKAFQACTESEKKAFIDWIYSAKTEQTKADRIAEMIRKLLTGEKFTKKAEL